MSARSEWRPEQLLARSGGVVELLRLPAAVFGAVAAARGALYDRGLLPAARVDLPVVCVGNLTAGGTGKTPAVVWVARRLQARGLRPGVLSRGYKRGAEELGDEGRLLATLLPGVPHVADPDRVAGATELSTLGVDVIVLDDGFQHRRLARDLDLVLIDATRPWGLPAPPGGGAPVRALLPRGLLREAPRGLRRAGAVILTRVDQVEPSVVDALEAEVERIAPGLAVCRAVHAPRELVRLGAEERAPFEDLAGTEVDLVSGIGNPRAFEDLVVAAGARVREHRCFPDHHGYTAGDLEGLGAPNSEGRTMVLTTSKDAVKLEATGGLPASLWVFSVELELCSGEPVLEALLDALPRGRRELEQAAFHEGLHG